MKKGWSSPVLMSLVRGNPEEVVLTYCKACDPLPKNGPLAAYTGCYQPMIRPKCVGCRKSQQS